MITRTSIIVLIVFSIFLAPRILKRLDQKSTPGCFSWGYMSFLVFCVSLIAFGMFGIMIDWSTQELNKLFDKSSHIATVIDIKEKWDDRTHQMSYSSILQIETADGKFETFTADDSSPSRSEAGPIGKKVPVPYNAKYHKTVFVAPSTIAIMLALLLLTLFCLFVFAGMVCFGFGFDMNRFGSITNSFFMLYFIPFLLIAIDLTLIYAYWYNRPMHFSVAFMLIFVIFSLSVGIVSYIRHVITKGPPVWHQVGRRRWTIERY